MIEISKELLSEVLDEYIDAVKLDRNEIVYAFRVSSCGMTPHGYTHDEGSINIYELAHKCKEWAVSQGYNITSKVTIRGGRGCKTKAVATARLIADTSAFKIYSANAEPQSIFKACQWILKEIK